MDFRAVLREKEWKNDLVKMQMSMKTRIRTLKKTRNSISNYVYWPSALLRSQCYKYKLLTIMNSEGWKSITHINHNHKCHKLTLKILVLIIIVSAVFTNSIIIFSDINNRQSTSLWILNISAAAASSLGIIAIYRYGVQGTHGRSYLFLTQPINLVLCWCCRIILLCCRRSWRAKACLYKWLVMVRRIWISISTFVYRN